MNIQRINVDPPAIVVVALVALLTWFSFQAVNPEAELFDQAFDELNRFSMVENALYRHIFTARAGMLRNYDPIVEDVGALRDSLQRLQDTAATDPAARPAVERLSAIVDRQEALVERFKTENALLQNSLSFFGRFGVHPRSAELDPAISSAAAAILHLALDTSSPTVRDVQSRLDELDLLSHQTGLADSVEALLAHGRLLNRLLPSVDNTLRTLHGLFQKRDLDMLRATILTRQLETRASARLYRALLYATSLALVAFLFYLGLRLKGHARALRRRAEFEHIIADISMRFINADAQTLPAEIDRALAKMCEFVGPDRAYFVMTSPTPSRHVWSKPGMEFPAGWPEHAPELAAQIGIRSDGTVRITNIQRMPVGEGKAMCMALGLGGWACALSTTEDGVTATLGFDAVGRPCQATAGELALMRMALDTIVRAIERRSSDEERARLEARLLQAKRMEQIGFFTSGIAHNFNNILGGILGHSEVIEEHIGSDARLVRNLGAIRRNAERARDLVDQILVFGRRRHNDRKPLSVGALIAEAATLLDVSLPDEVELIIRQPPTAAIVTGEHTKLQQVLLNLCRNAANAMPDGGRIEIATELHRIPEALVLSPDTIEAGAYVCISVTDNGQGMDDATRERIFEPFFTTRQSGNGLGLATVRDIVREHGGALNVQSKPGAGSRFEIWLPRASSAVPDSELSSGVRPIGSGETIMLVAHEEACVLRDEEVLAALGYEPVGFVKSELALAACRADPSRFDMVVVGHFGSAIASLKVAATLHAAIPRVPIVLATKSAFEIAADTLVNAGIVDVVRWPLLANEIAIALANSTTPGRTSILPPQRTGARQSISLH
jgi:signal transduction histidine kinase/CheY-like chemotaxis protein